MKSKFIYIGMTLALGVTQAAFANYNDEQISLDSDERYQREQEVSGENEWNEPTYNEDQGFEDDRNDIQREEEMIMDESPALETNEMEEYQE